MFGMMIVDAVRACHGAFKLYQAMLALRAEANEARAKRMEIEQEHGAASEGTRTTQEQDERPLGLTIPLKEQVDDDFGENPEIKSSDEVLADDILRTEAKFLARAVAEAEKLAREDPDDPNYKPPDTPRVTPLVLRKACGDAVVNKKNTEQTMIMENAYIRDCASDDERIAGAGNDPNTGIRGRPFCTNEKNEKIAIKTSYLWVILAASKTSKHQFQQ